MPYGLGELKPFTPFSSLISGVGAGEQLQASGLKRQAAQLELDRAREMTGALQEYKQTNDPQVFKGINPEMAIKLQDHLDKQTPDALKGYEKAANFIQKSRGIITPQNWPNFKADMEKQGWLQPGSLPDQVDDKSLQQILYMPELIQSHIKALPQRLAAESRERVADAQIASREQVAADTNASRERAVGTSAGARIEAAKIRASKETKPAKLTDYGDFKETYREEFLQKNGRYPTAVETRTAWTSAKPATGKTGGAYTSGRKKPAGTGGTGYQGPAYYYDKEGKEVAVHSQDEYNKLVGK